MPNPVGTAGAALSGNIANLGQIYGLTGGLNASLAGQQRGQIAAGLPDYNQMVSQSSANILSQAQGRIPTDVVNQILQTAAEKGILSRGTNDAPVDMTSLIRTLGLTSLGLTNNAEQLLTGAIARTPQPQLVRPENFLVSPEQMQEAQYASNTMASAPIPALAGMAGYGAARQGYNQGVGAISTPRMNPFAPQSNYNPFEPQSGGYGPPEVALSANPVEASPVPNFASSWANWAASLPQNPTASYGSDYKLGNPAQPNLFPQEEDYYNV